MAEITNMTLNNSVALSIKNNVMANNIANHNTIAYKRDVVIFKDVINNIGTNMNSPSPRLHSVETLVDHSTGPLTSTQNSLDLAIVEPQHFFAIQSQNGIKYTRAGNFMINKEKVLVNPDGLPVMSKHSSQIVFNNANDNVKIDSHGTIVDENGNEIATVGVFFFKNPQVLKKEGGNNFISTVDTKQLATNYTIMQGFLEGSNVQSISENFEMIANLRSAEETFAITKNVNNYYKNLSSLLKPQ